MTEVEELYKERIQALERTHKDYVELQTLRFEDANERLKTIIHELQAQADGLLGALGRLGTENAALKEILEKIQAEMRDREADYSNRKFEIETESRKIATIAREEIAKLKSALGEAMAKIQGLKDQK